jgi:hypothetical protein
MRACQTERIGCNQSVRRRRHTVTVNFSDLPADNTVLEVGGETTTGAVGDDWIPNYDLTKRHYNGPHELTG